MSKLDIITAKHARELIGIGKTEMCQIVNEMRRAGYTVTRDGNITWIRPSELEQYLLYERDRVKR